MRTTLELPDDLVKQVKIRAVREGRKLKDMIADLLRKGLSVADPGMSEPVIATDRKTGLPVIQCVQTAPVNDEMTPQRVADILISQDAEWHHAARR